MLESYQRIECVCTEEKKRVPLGLPGLLLDVLVELSALLPAEREITTVHVFLSVL